jgi:hypothetical protein
VTVRDTIFISYRTDDGWAAEHIYKELSGPFGEANVFLDWASIGDDDDVEPVLWSGLDRSCVVLVLIGRYWLVDHSNRKIADDPDDYVRMEIRRALTLGIPVIPILLDDTPLPSPADLPEALRELSFRKPLHLRARDQAKDLPFFVDVLRYILDRPPAGGGIRPYTALGRTALALALMAALSVVLGLATDLRYNVNAWLVGVGGAFLAMVAFALALFDVRPSGWSARRRLRAHGRFLPASVKPLVSDLRSQARRLRWPQRPARWTYVGCAALIALAALFVAAAPAVRCIGKDRRAFGFETGNNEGWYPRSDRGVVLGTGLAVSRERVRGGGRALRFDFDIAPPPGDKGQIAVDRAALGGILDGWAWVGVDAPTPLTASAYALERIPSSSGPQWMTYRTDPVALAPGAWTHLTFRPSDFTHAAGEPPHPSPPPHWSDPPRLLGLEVRAARASASGISSRVYFDDITVC